MPKMVLCSQCCGIEPKNKIICFQCYSGLKLKKHKQFSHFRNEVNSRHAANNLSLDWPKKPDAVNNTFSWELRYII